MIHLDVLIVYNEKAASSALASLDHATPFLAGSPNDAYNEVYGYFLDSCRKLHLKAGFSTSADIIGPGKCQSYWSFSRNKWHKVLAPCYSTQIFAKYSPTTKPGKLKRQLLFSSKVIKPYNSPDLFNLFFDKQRTYDALTDHAIPTISLGVNTLNGIGKSCTALSNLLSLHPSSDDFSPDIVMKDRYGAGGRHVYKFKSGQVKKMLDITTKNSNISFIIQPFARFDQGFTYNGSRSSTDIRFVYLGGEIVQSYIRKAKKEEFRCNEHQGGLLTYLPLSAIPERLITKSNQIAKILNKKTSLYSLDFIISNNGNPYFLEGNTGPGLDWSASLKQNESKSKKLIRLLVKDLASRIEVSNLTSPKDAR